ncbi:MAG TPA: glycosyltransferase family 2 protein [Solirubrobacteraceae bacterium]|jgi:N-acetylglucosaminyl-diphospho-decaprenol L-rhamnosyltransferase|nr:glycosyltransferase family 2 protein [Solirubrobacteraceae bacterium]
MTAARRTADDAAQRTSTDDRGMPPELDAAIVIVNYRTSELVERCVASVRADAGELRMETVIVDNDSGDGSVERLRSALPSATVIAMPENGGFAAGVNVGFANSRADTVVVLNPDTELAPNALSLLLARLREHQGTGVVAPLLEDAEGHLTANGYRRFPNLLTLAVDLCLPVGYALVHAPALHPYVLAPNALCAGSVTAHVCGAVMAIRRQAYEQAGSFDEGFFLYLEETEWQQRVAARGWAIEVVPAARALHLVRGGGDESLVPSPHFVTSALRYLRLQGVPPTLSRAVLSAALALSWVLLLAIAWLPAKRERARLQARGYRALLRRTWAAVPE